MNTSSLISLALAIAISQGRDALKRAFTPPEDWVRKTCAKTGADPEACLEERNENAKAWAAFIEDLANVQVEADDDQPAVAEHKQVAGLKSSNINLVQIAVMLYTTFGRETVRRMLTVPQAQVEAVCKKTGADVQEVLASRNAATEELMEFIESLVDKNFKDPD